MSSDDVLRQVRLIQEVMGKAMKEGEHYGVIPGTDKPSLLKSGAEKLSLTFRLRPKFGLERLDLAGEHREYVVTCDLFNQAGGHEGQGIGSCSTMESKYRWRQAKRQCPSCGAEAIHPGQGGVRRRLAVLEKAERLRGQVRRHRPRDRRAGGRPNRRIPTSPTPSIRC